MQTVDGVGRMDFREAPAVGVIIPAEAAPRRAAVRRAAVHVDFDVLVHDGIDAVALRVDVPVPAKGKDGVEIADIKDGALQRLFDKRRGSVALPDGRVAFVCLRRVTEEIETQQFKTDVLSADREDRLAPCALGFYLAVSVTPAGTEQKQEDERKENRGKRAPKAVFHGLPPKIDRNIV